MTQVSITTSSSYYQVSFILQGIPNGVTPLNTIDGSVVPTDILMEPNPPELDPPPIHLPYDEFDVYPPPSPPTLFILTGDILGNDVISVSDTTYVVTVVDSRSRELVSQAVYSITGDIYDLDTETPISVTAILSLN